MQVQVHILFKSTDWYVNKKEEISTAIPSKITAYRTAVD